MGRNFSADSLLTSEQELVKRILEFSARCRYGLPNQKFAQETANLVNNLQVGDQLINTPAITYQVTMLFNGEQYGKALACGLPIWDCAEALDTAYFIKGFPYDD